MLSPFQLLRPRGLYACQALLSIGISKQEYWTGVGCHFLLQMKGTENLKEKKTFGIQSKAIDSKNKHIHTYIYIYVYI